MKHVSIPVPCFEVQLRNMVIEKETPDLILLDIVMPKMDGITMVNELRKEKWGKDGAGHLPRQPQRK